jgi:hypothetical protein
MGLGLDFPPKKVKGCKRVSEKIEYPVFMKTTLKEETA